MIGAGAAINTNAHQAEQDLLTPSEQLSQESEFHNIMRRANNALLQRDAAQALSLYEQAATQFGEKPEAELGQIRARLLNGSFREALAFANLVVGEHTDFPPAIALLALIEDRSGHMETAIARLEAALQRWPESDALLGALAEILIDRGDVTKSISVLNERIANRSDNIDILRLRARAAMRVGDAQALISWRSRVANAYADNGQPPRAQLFTNSKRTTPFDPELISTNQLSGDWPPPAFEQWPAANPDQINIGNGVVIGSGLRVITAASLAERVGQRVFVRNGLGHVREGRVESLDESTGLAVLLLDSPYDSKSSIEPVGFKAATPGGFCFALGFPVVGDIDGNYPVLSQGVVVRTRMGSATLTQFTAWLSPDQRGAPLFDSAGNLIGIYRGTGDQIDAARRDGLGNGNFAAGIQAISTQFRMHEAAQNPPEPTPTLRSSDELYEKLLPKVVGIIVVR